MLVRTFVKLVPVTVRHPSGVFISGYEWQIVTEYIPLS
jgi:alpha-L-arabinofuranosidase